MKDLTAKHFVLGFQHLFAMFGATVLVPTLTGLNPSIALLAAGLGTLVFHLITGGKVPVFLGSSFAFIGGITLLMDGNAQNIPIVQGGVIAAGLVYVLFSVIIYFVGTDRIKKLFPPVVTAPVIIVIGLNLSPSAIANASTCWPLAILVLAVIICVMCFSKGFFKLVPILIGLASGYLIALLLDVTGLTALWNLAEGGRFIDFKAISEAGWIISPSSFTLPKFDVTAITMLAPIALVTFMEHIGDITTNGAVVGKDFYKDPGLHRTLLGDGIATAVSGLIGGPPNTTYGENTGVLAVTKMYDPRLLRITACYAIILGVFAKFGAVLQTIPVAVMGGVSMVLFGMIASVGLRSLCDAKLDFSHSRNLLIVAVVLVIGLGLGDASVKWIFDLFGAGDLAIAQNLKLSGLFVATVVGVIMNQVLPQEV